MKRTDRQEKAFWGAEETPRREQENRIRNSLQHDEDHREAYFK
jgi:hypothetical protein